MDEATADRVHSALLLVSLVAGSLSLAIPLVTRALPATPSRWPAFGRALVTLAGIAWLAALLSVTVHLKFGHAPGTPQALSTVDFVREHVAVVVAAVLPAAGLALCRSGRRQGRA